MLMFKNFEKQWQQQNSFYKDNYHFKYSWVATYDEG
jgi:hypothetical protein